MALTTQEGVEASAFLAAHQPISLTLDYSQIPLRYGGSFADRLTLYRVTRCDGGTIAAASGGENDCLRWDALATRNDLATQTLAVTLFGQSNQEEGAGLVEPPAVEEQSLFNEHLYLPLVTDGQMGGPREAEDVLYVLAAAAESQQGSYKATPLANVSDYQVSLASGSFQTSYPIPVPPAAAGAAPAVVLRYDSGHLDGMTTTKNNQPGWAGIGWSLEGGYITRHLKICGSSAGNRANDLCLTGDNYSLVLNGVTARLVKVSGNSYRLQSDPNWKVELLTTGPTGHPDAQKEYWRVTTPDGTQFRFGGEIDPETSADQNSVYYTTVYSTDNAYCGTFDQKLCDKAWQWNLDRVEDTNGNVTSYFYELETNYYQPYALSSSYRKQYVRAGYLSRIEYGRRTGQTGAFPTRVNLVVEERCEGACTWPTNYPDTPGDLVCAATGTCSQNTPTFWSRKRLKSVEPQTYNQSTSTWTSVARYDLAFSFPTPPNDAQGDTSEKKLWLNSITQKLGDGSGGLPAVQYGYIMRANRYDHNVAGVSPLNMPRLNQVTTQLGGVVSVTYGQSHACLTHPGSNIRRTDDCAPGWYITSSDAGWGYFNKWKVTQLTLSDSFSGNDTQTFTYSYSNPIWHYSDDPSLADINSCSWCHTRHWNDFRGSAIVTVTDSSGAKTEHRFYRGMHGDRNTTSGGSFSASITLSDNTTRTDENWLRGQAAEIRRLTSTNAVRQRTVNWFTWTLNAGSGISGAYFVGLQASEETLTNTASKKRRTEYSYDAYGNVTRAVHHGEYPTPTSDDRNIEYSYLYNTTAYIVDRPQWQKVWTGTTSGSAGQEKAFTEYAYDNLAYGTAPTKGNLTKGRAYWQTTPSYQSVETTTAYDSAGRPTVVTDARNNSTTTAYHSFYGSVTSVTNDLGHVTSYVNDPGWGVVTQSTDPNNKVTNLQYDGYGRLLKVWLPSETTGEPASLEFVYDAAARPAWVKSRQLQVKASSTYLESWQYVDGFGRTLQSQTPAATGGNRIVSSQKYSNRGLLLYQSAPYQLAGAAGSGYSAPTWSTVANYHQFYYDELGRQTKDETRNLTTLLWDVETIYDAWTQQQYDANDRRRDAIYNAFGHLVQVKEYYATNSFYTTHYAYDLLGNLTGVTDHNSNTTSMSYDLLGRKTAMTDPDMGSWQYQYDAVGNLTGQRDGRSQWLYLEYDDLNRFVRKRRDTPSTGPLVAEYGYDAVGQKGLLSFSKAYNSAGTAVEAEVQAVSYDTRNRLTQQRWVVAGSGTFRLDYAYNEADQRTGLTYPGGTGGQQGEVVSYSYNAIGQLTGVSGSGVQYVSSATYNAQGQLTELRNDSGANGLTRQFVYETNTLRLSTIRAGTASPFENLQKLTYGYDNAGNITSLTDTLNSSQKQCFQYDWLGRLTAAFTGNSGCTAYSATGAGPYNHTYAYDAIGNLTSYAGNGYTYGGGKPHAVTAAFGNSYGYDANGNQTSRTIGGTTYTFTFDYENRLTAISGGSVSATFVYDADGNRVKGTVGGVTTVYVAGLYEYQGGATTHYYEGNALRRTGYGSNNGVFYLLQDHLKSSSAVINQNGTLNAQHYYYPFGGNRGGAFSPLTTKRFTGQYHEAGLPGGEGLSYYNARWYDAKLGRFISADTIVPNPANPQAFNRYSYVFNNPLRFTDPSGRCPVGYCPIFDPGPGSGGGSKPAPQKVYAPIFYAMRPPTTYRVYLPVVNSSPNYRPTMAHVQSACPGSIVCLPTSKPTAAIPPLLPPWVPLPTPQPQLRPGPTYTSTPTPTIILTPTPTSTPIPLGSVNAPALGWDIVGLLTAGIPEKVGAPELYGKAVAKSIPGIGYSFAIGPNVSSHFQEDGLSAVIKPGLYSDLVTDTAGYFFAQGTGIIGGATGVYFGPQAGLGGYVGGSVGGNVAWDVWIGPQVKGNWIDPFFNWVWGK